MFLRKPKKANPAEATIPVVKKVITEKGEIAALDFGSDAEQCYAYLKAALRKENSATACFVSDQMKPALWTLLTRAHLNGRVWTKDVKVGRKQVNLFKPLGMAF